MSHTEMLPNTVRILAGVYSDLLYAIHGNLPSSHVNDERLCGVRDEVAALIRDWNSRHVGNPALTIAGHSAEALSDEERA